MKINNDEWLKILRAGDKVYIDSGRFGPTDLNLTTVKKITQKGHVRTENNMLFRGGHRRIDAWQTISLVQWTQELEIKERNSKILSQKIHKMKNTDWSNISIEKINKIYSIAYEGLE